MFWQGNPTAAVDTARITTILLFTEYNLSGFNSNSMTNTFNSLNAELNPTCYLLALLGAHHILHVSRETVNTGQVS